MSLKLMVTHKLLHIVHSWIKVKVLTHIIATKQIIETDIQGRHFFSIYFALAV